MALATRRSCLLHLLTRRFAFPVLAPPNLQHLVRLPECWNPGALPRAGVSSDTAQQAHLYTEAFFLAFTQTLDKGADKAVEVRRARPELRRNRRRLRGHPLLEILGPASAATLVAPIVTCDVEGEKMTRHAGAHPRAVCLFDGAQNAGVARPFV